MDPKSIRPNFGGWHYSTYYIISGGSDKLAETEQDTATNRIIEATLAGMEQFPDAKKILDRIAGM
jgi:hypothetical protein